MDEDDDLYGGTAGDAQKQESKRAENEADMDGDQEEEEEEEEDESDDDVQFTLEKPEGAKSSTPAAQTKKLDPSSDSKSAKTGTPIKTEQAQRSSSTAPTSQQEQSTTKATLTHSGKEGKDFPAIRTSTLDVNTNPLWPDANGKPITEVDIDADLSEHSKPWRLPGTDQTDFFNYGFDEFTWAQYAIRQQTMAGTIQEQKKQDEAMKAMFGGGGPPGGPMGGPPGGGGGGFPGMPSEQEMMQMMASGMTEEQFMQRMMGGGMMGGGPPQGPGGGNFGPQGPGFGGPPTGPGGGSFGGGGGGRVPSGSPHPQGQGFQPPTGPSAQSGQGGQDGFMGNMEGYSPQQMAIMQQQQGGGRGRGRGRGRGYY